MARFKDATGQEVFICTLRTGEYFEIQLSEAAPGAVVVTSDTPLVLSVSAARGIGYRFRLLGLSGGGARVEARVAPGRDPIATLRVYVSKDGWCYFYHGTTVSQGRQLVDADIGPMMGAMIMPSWPDYTDFGKGFYVHSQENKERACEWARRNYGKEAAVVEFPLTPAERDATRRNSLYFRNKKARPGNAPLLPQSTRPASWIEFIEFNRGIPPKADRGRLVIQKKNDQDWSALYSVMIGPIWVPRDSGYDTGVVPFPDDLHQWNWGQTAMGVINQAECKGRRRVIAVG